MSNFVSVNSFIHLHCHGFILEPQLQLPKRAIITFENDTLHRLLLNLQLNYLNLFAS